MVTHESLRVKGTKYNVKKCWLVEVLNEQHTRSDRQKDEDAEAEHMQDKTFTWILIPSTST